ncbi:MAG TPA: alpha/beta fold hydrolase [Longimicrobiales bacterium]|nr:alpha/beta fold hydrolase [Longimicrobiales bacterium]
MAAHPLHLRHAGAADDGKGNAGTIVFLHGFPLAGSLWDAQMASLPDGWRGIAPDLRGFGRSPLGAAELPDGGAYPGVADPHEAVLTMDAMAADVARLVDEEVGGPVVICGLSMGGYVAFALWRQRPDLVRGLVLADTRAAADDPEGLETRRRMAETARTGGVEPIARAMVPKLLVPATMEGRPDVVEKVGAMIRGTSPRTIVAAVAGMAARPDSTPDLATIHVPTLVVVGTEDAITPVDGARAMAAALDAPVAEVPGAGHLTPVENPGAVNRALAEFLAP